MTEKLKKVEKDRENILKKFIEKTENHIKKMPHQIR